VIVIGIDPIATRAYIAGLIDGEGTIGIKRRMPSSRNSMKAPKYSAHVGIAMTDRDPVACVAEFCGKPDRVTFRVRKDGHKTIYEFAVENTAAAKLLREVRPYLVGKTRQADVAIEFAALREKSRAHRTKVVSTGTFASGRAQGHTYRSFGLSDEYIADCEDLYQKLLKGNPRSGQPGRFGSRTCS
jgi:hypothetical protein